MRGIAQLVQVVYREGLHQRVVRSDAQIVRGIIRIFQLFLQPVRYPA